MPQPKFVYDSNLTPQQNMEALIPKLNHLLAFLDSKNVGRLYTNRTVIKSEDGSTEIQGPLLVMKDKQGTPIIRLKMGYDEASTNFVHQLMNASGDITVSLDSNGNLVVERGTFKGSITIGTGNDVFKAGEEGIWLGHADYMLAPFKVSKAGQAEATNLIITGGSISVDTDIYVGNNIFLGNMAATDKNIAIYNDGLGNYCLFQFDAAGKLHIYNVGGDIEIISDGTTDVAGSNVVITCGSTSGFTTLVGKTLLINNDNAVFDGDMWGIFGKAAIQQTAANLGTETVFGSSAGATYTVAEQAIINALILDMRNAYSKVQGILDKLSEYGLFEITP